MRYSRFLAALTAAMLLVVYSGCGSEDKKEAGSPGSGGVAQAKDGDKAAGQSVAASSSAAQRPAADKGAIDVSLVTPDDFAAIVIHPRRIAQSPLLAEVLKDETIAGAIKKFGIDPSEVEQMVVLFCMVERFPGHPQPLPTTITHFTRDMDAKELLTRLRAAEGSTGPHHPIEEVQVAGKTCLDPGGIVLGYALTKNTIVIAPREIMAKVVSAAQPKGPLLARLQNADADNDIIVATEPLPDFDQLMDASKKHAPLDLDAVKKLQGGTATINLTAPSILRAVLDAKDADAAADIEESLQYALKMAGESLAQSSRIMPAKSQDSSFVKLAEQVIGGAKVAKSGSQVTLDVKRPEILDTAGASIVSAVKQSVMEARAASRRVQQMNNMHQIGIAMIGYEEAYQSMPPAIIEKDGKPLLSWRVAILPFFEETGSGNRFHLDEPWNSPHNLEAAKNMPSVYQSPDSPKDGKTRVMLFTGKGAAFDGAKKVQGRISNTILCVEAGPDKAVPWTKPEDLPFDPENPLAVLGNVSAQGFPALFFDGHVEQLKVDNKTLKALITPGGRR